MTTETVFTNARLVLRDGIVEGSLVVADGRIRAIDGGPTSVPSAIDLGGALLIPGLIELHTDNMEKHLVPRPGVLWPQPVAAILAHDLQIAGAGITTVYDAITIGEYHENSLRRRILADSVEAVTKARTDGLLRADHLIHLRCELSDPAVVDMWTPYVDNPLVVLVSLMDHTPGQRQWRDISKMVQYNKLEGWSPERLQAYIDERVERQGIHARPNRESILAMFAPRGLPLASHDDTLVEHVDEAVGDGVLISEFPTTVEAARAARDKGMAIVMGAPNVVRGGSHSGNVSALDLAGEGLLDGLSSDYVPASLLQSAITLNRDLAIALPDAIGLVTTNVADMLGLDDRGEIAVGRRADLVQVDIVDAVPVVRTVWREGMRVC
ncbi:MAG: alpha-D-ribose 1-methylphosphonate 5-triphosphate diphosphatase [Alphaproteobacteria bacterium]